MDIDDQIRKHRRGGQLRLHDGPRRHGGHGAKGEITSITSSGGAKSIPCTVERSGVCQSNVEVEAQGLPWKTELVVVNGVLRNKYTAEHQWKVVCKTLGEPKRENECNVSPTVGPHNVSGGVEEINDSSSASTGCFDDRAGDQFITRGTEKLASTAGTVSIAPAPLEWQQAGKGLFGPITSEWSGKVKLAVSLPKSGKFVMECSEKAEGPVGLGSVGELTTLPFSGCSAQQSNLTCEVSKEPMVALSLPWHTELQTIGGAVHDVIVNSSKEAPKLKASCVFLGIRVTYECSGSVAPAMTNGSSGVTATFAASEKLVCTEGAWEGSGSLEGAQTVTASGGKLEVT
ncbi:MAG TPA: hypothetical protein VGL57_09735 [Solirubrobacteraceae bacterium]|jgi:hypothetical protein